MNDVEKDRIKAEIAAIDSERKELWPKVEKEEKQEATFAVAGIFLSIVSFLSACGGFYACVKAIRGADEMDGEWPIHYVYIPILLGILFAVLPALLIRTKLREKYDALGRKRERFVKQLDPEAHKRAMKTLSGVYEGFLLNADMVCPHCNQKGYVQKKKATRKTGISGAKATGAVLTGGLSTAFTGLSRKDEVTECLCGNCESRWAF